MVKHVHIGDLEVPVWFGVVHEPAVEILVITFFMNCCVRGTFPPIRRITLRRAKLVYISAMKFEKETSKSLIVTNNVFAVAGNPNKDAIRFPRQTMMAPRSKSSVLFVFLLTRLRFIDSEPWTLEWWQFIIAKSLRNILLLVLPNV